MERMFNLRLAIQEKQDPQQSKKSWVLAESKYTFLEDVRLVILLTSNVLTLD